MAYMVRPERSPLRRSNYANGPRVAVLLRLKFSVTETADIHDTQEQLQYHKRVSAAVETPNHPKNVGDEVDPVANAAPSPFLRSYVP